MLAYFGTDIDQGEGTVGMDEDGVEGVSAEWGDKKQSLSFLKVLALRDSIEEVGVDELFPGIPDMAVLLINNRVLVRVVVVSSKARQGGEEVVKGSEVDKDRCEEVGRRW